MYATGRSTLKSFICPLEDVCACIIIASSMIPDDILRQACRPHFDIPWLHESVILIGKYLVTIGSTGVAHAQRADGQPKDKRED
jgi:hypothetical protein